MSILRNGNVACLCRLNFPCTLSNLRKWSCHYDFQAPVWSLLKAACLLSVTCRCDDFKGLEPYMSTTVLIPHSRERVPYNYVNKNTHRYSLVCLENEERPWAGGVWRPLLLKILGKDDLQMYHLEVVRRPPPPPPHQPPPVFQSAQPLYIR